jgi:hypothetical protein
MSLLTKIEDTYLKIFKVVLLLILTLALVASAVILIKGLTDFSAKPLPVEPAKEAPAPKVDVELFIEELKKRDAPAVTNPVNPPAEAPKPNPMDELAASHLAKAWSYYDAFQKACNVSNKIDQDAFMGAEFPRNNFRSWFHQFGPDFAASQDQFLRTVLSNPAVVKICIDKQGRGGVFGGSLKWHHDVWDMQIKEIIKFERAEERRVEMQTAQEQARIAAKRAEGLQMLWGALIAFGVFMSLALLLIFSKIETNLRDLKRQDLQG